jgi:hypothetical protein
LTTFPSIDTGITLADTQQADSQLHTDAQLYLIILQNLLSQQANRRANMVVQSQQAQAHAQAQPASVVAGGGVGTAMSDGEDDDEEQVLSINENGASAHVRSGDGSGGGSGGGSGVEAAAAKAAKAATPAAAAAAGHRTPKELAMDKERSEALVSPPPPLSLLCVCHVLFFLSLG